jgi:hypothetical protein
VPTAATSLTAPVEVITILTSVVEELFIIETQPQSPLGSVLKYWERTRRVPPSTKTPSRRTKVAFALAWTMRIARGPVRG